MRLGCLGCFALLLILFVILVAVAGVLFLSANIFTTPDTRPAPFSRADGYAAQSKLYEVVLRQSGRSSRQDPIVLSEREANAFLSRHLAEAAALPLAAPRVVFSRGQILVQGQTSLRNLLQGPPFAQLVPLVPDKRLEDPVWVTVRGRIAVERSLIAGGASYGKVELTHFTLGRQPISPMLFYIMIGPAGGALLRWQVPPNVESVEIEDGRLVIRTH